MGAEKSIASHTLGRANFFLNCAEACERVDRSSFEYFFEAAIIYGRSVTFHLQKEFSKKKGFEDWYNKKQDEMREDELFKFIIDKRNYILKQGPIVIKNTIMLGLSENIIMSDFMEVHIIRGAPWHERGVKVIIEDLSAFFRDKYNKWKYERELSRRRKLRSNLKTSEIRELYHFEEEAWCDRAATELVKVYLRKIECLVKEAESLFLK